MYKLAKPVALLCETSLHAGSGIDLGAVDMPIQRERHTGFPKVESSGIKGSFRQAFYQLEEVSVAGITLNKEQNRKKELALSFGPEDGGLHAGALGFTDARLLLFPVKSAKGVFAWITCPLVLQRFRQDLKRCNQEVELPIPPESSTPENSKLYVKDNKIVLEEYTFEIKNFAHEDCSRLANWLSKYMLPKDENYAYLREKMLTDLVVLSDTDFSDFVNLSTEIITRTKIDPKTGTVQGGALFSEEYLPSETLLYTMVLTTPIFNKDKGAFTPKAGRTEEQLVMDYFVHNLPSVIQLGGNATIGKGLIRTKAVEV